MSVAHPSEVHSKRADPVRLLPQNPRQAPPDRTFAALAWSPYPISVGIAQALSNGTDHRRAVASESGETGEHTARQRLEIPRGHLENHVPDSEIVESDKIHRSQIIRRKKPLLEVVP